MRIPENTSKNTHNVVAEIVSRENFKRILDIPCGAGAFAARFSRPDREVHGADIENLITATDVVFTSADMNCLLPYEDFYFDAVACIDGIEHLENPFSFVRECRRIIRAGGMLIISTPNINSVRSRWRWFWTSHHNKNKVPLNESKRNFLHHINMMDYQRLRYILHTNGFTIQQIKTNRVKAVSWLYMIFVPFSYAFTKFVYRREEKDVVQRRINEVISKHLFSISLLFGETMIVKAVKNSET